MAESCGERAATHVPSCRSTEGVQSWLWARVRSRVGRRPRRAGLAHGCDGCVPAAEGGELDEQRGVLARCEGLVGLVAVDGPFVDAELLAALLDPSHGEFLSAGMPSKVRGPRIASTGTSPPPKKRLST